MSEGDTGEEGGEGEGLYVSGVVGVCIKGSRR